jgi:hypothetical protein
MFLFDPFPLSLKLINHTLVLVKICNMPAPYNAVNHLHCQYTNLRLNTEIGAPRCKLLAYCVILSGRMK